MLRKILPLFGLGLALFIPSASAHEAYVLPADEFRNGLRAPGFNVFNALSDPQNFRTFLIIGGAAAIAVLATAMLEYFEGRAIAGFFERGRKYAQPILRLSFGLAIFFSALTNSFLGPELALTSLSTSLLLRAALFLAGVLLIFGFMAELGALIALAAFLIAITKDGLYLANYSNYLAEIITVLTFGAGAVSLDAWLRAGRKTFSRFREYEALLIRIGYGAALLFTTITVKFLHPILPLTVVNEYHLTRFHLLFPGDPALVVMGAALVEFTIGFFILIGFETRLVVLVSLFYMTLSLFFFGEAVWPHLILYGLSGYLLLAPQKFSVDGWLERRRAAARQD